MLAAAHRGEGGAPRTQTNAGTTLSLLLTQAHSLCGWKIMSWVLSAPHHFHNGGAASSSTRMRCKSSAGGSSVVCCLCRGRSFGGAQRASNACYLGGLLLPPPDHNLPGASAGSRHVRLFEAMGARTLPGPKPAKKRPMCSPPGAGRKGRERSPHAHLKIIYITGQRIFPAGSSY